jgi:hypothetical protein
MSRPAHLSGTLWPIHLKPLDEELLSSWMIRLARAYAIKPVWFWRLFWPVDFRNVDWAAPGGLLELLALKTAAPLDRTVQTTLTVLSQAHAIASSLRYCPVCLVEDTEPYFRRRWQMPFLLLCERHGAVFLQGCPHCRRPLRPELVPLSRDSMAWCSHCGHDLRRPERESIPPSRARHQVLDWERRLWKLVEAG